MKQLVHDNFIDEYRPSGAIDLKQVSHNETIPLSLSCIKTVVWLMKLTRCYRWHSPMCSPPLCMTLVDPSRQDVKASKARHLYIKGRSIHSGCCLLFHGNTNGIQDHSTVEFLMDDHVCMTCMAARWVPPVQPHHVT